MTQKQIFLVLLFYIVSSTDLVVIWYRPKIQLNFGNHPNEELQKDWNELDDEAYELEIIIELKEKKAISKDYKNEVEELGYLYIEVNQLYGENSYSKKENK